MSKTKPSRSVSMVFVWLATMSASFFNWIYNITLNRLLPLDEYSQVGAILNTVLIFAGVALACQYAATKFTPESERQSRRALGDVINTHLTVGFLFGVMITLTLIVLEPVWSTFLFLSTPKWVNVLLALTPTVLLLLSMIRGILFGWRTYYLAGTLLIVESLVKLCILGWGYLTTQTFSYSLVAIPVSMGIASVIGFAFIVFEHRVKLTFGLSRSWLPRIMRFIMFSFITATSAQVFLFIDTIAVRHYFSPDEAGVYATVSLVGKMIFYFITSILMLLTPEVAFRTAATQDSSGILKRSLIFALICGLVCTIVFALFPQYSLALFLDPYKVFLGRSLLLPYGVAVTAMSIVTIMATYYLFAGYRLFIIVIVVGIVLELIAFWLFHQHLVQIVSIVLCVGILESILIPIIIRLESISKPTISINKPELGLTNS